MQIRKKTSLLLLLTMLMTLFPAATPVIAAETTTNIQLVKDTSNNGGITTGQMIYFGQYTKSDNNKAPIQWRVMGVENGKATLMSEYILEHRKYDISPSSAHNNWSDSDICKYLNSVGTYASDGFLNTAFTQTEQGYIREYSLAQESGYKAADIFIPNQKIVLPSVKEMEDGGFWGFNDNASRVADNIDGLSGSHNQYWWLRSPGADYYLASYVFSNGAVGDGGNSVLGVLGVRPALKLDLSASVLFASGVAGEGAKKSGESSILNSINSTSSEMKLTLIDKYDTTTNQAGQKTVTAAAKGKYIPGEATEIEIEYANALTGTNQFLSAIITDSTGSLKYYGAIKKLSNSADAAGTAKVTIPEDFNGLQLKIFTEQLNGDKLTDYASEPVAVTVAAGTSEVGLTLHKGNKIYFGKKGDSPILWRVIEKDMVAETLTLMSEYGLEYRKYDEGNGVPENGRHKNWIGSDICKYLNSQESYASSGFLTTAFSQAEQNYIGEYSLTQESVYNSTDTFIPNQKIVLPSVSEMEDSGAWGFNDDASRMANNMQGISIGNHDTIYWWLRSPGHKSDSATYVQNTGEIYDYGASTYYTLGIRPALKLDLSYVSFTSLQSISAPDAVTGITNGIILEDLRSQLPEIVGATTSNSTKNLNVNWDLSTISYDSNVKVAQTFSIPGTVGLPEGLVKLPDGVTPNISISVTIDAAKYQIEHVLNEGTQAANAPTHYTYGGGAALPTPTREGYTFKGWYDNVSLTGDAITNIPATDSGNKRYWAKWGRITVAPTITTDSLSRGTVDKAYNHTLTATGDTPITWSIESGAIPQGLKLDAATGGISGTPTTAGNFGFTAKATNGIGSDTKALSINISQVLTTYTVTFDSNGGNAISPIINITSGEAIILPTPTRSSYRFEGWFNGTTQYINNTPITKNITLTAKWTELSSSGGGSSSGSSSGGGGNAGGNLTPTPAAPSPASPEAVKKAEETIQKLSSTQKQELAQNIEEYLPYTFPAAQGLTAEQLKVLTKDKFTKEELETLAKKPELLKALGVDINTLSSLAELKPIKNPAFKDVPATHWAADTIKKAAELGIAAGKEDGSFAPKQPLQIADTFTFLNRVLLLNNITENTLPRSTVEKYIIDKNHWAFSDMASIGAKLSENTLKAITQRGDQPLTREFLAQLLYEITKGKLKAVKEVPAFTDIQSSRYKEAINYCVSVGLLNGTGKNTMSPEKELTRAELMAVLIRLDQLI